MIFYVGTFSASGGEGLFTCELEGSKLTVLQMNAELPNPNYLIMAPDCARLFAVGGEKASGWRAASFDLKEGLPLFRSDAELGGADPCSLALSEKQDFLYTANYMGGNVSVLPISDGRLGQPVQIVRHEGSGPNVRRQEQAHPHQVSFSPMKKSLLQCVDLGLDQVISYTVDVETGRLSFSSSCDVEKGSGPRHLAYAKNGEIAYLAHEMGSLVSLLRFDGLSFTCVQTLSTLPEDFTGESTCAAIRLSPDGKRVYVSNRGHDSLAVFDIQPDDTLTARGYIPAQGRCPRDFRVLDDNRVLIANQDSGTVVLLNEEGAPLDELSIKGAVCIAY